MLTSVQLATLAAHIKANPDPDVSAALAQRNDTELARLYNLTSSFYVWKNEVTPDEYRSAIVWSDVEAMTAAQERVFAFVTGNQAISLDASDSNIRSGMQIAFAATTTLANLVATAKRQGSVYESVFASGTGSESTPGVLGVEGNVTIQIIGKALNENP